jgi:hypothetical protein
MRLAQVRHKCALRRSTQSQCGLYEAGNSAKLRAIAGTKYTLVSRTRWED